MSGADVVAALRTDVALGLPEDEVVRRRALHGSNTLEVAKGRGTWLILLDQFRALFETAALEPRAWLLVVAVMPGLLGVAVLLRKAAPVSAAGP